MERIFQDTGQGVGNRNATQAAAAFEGSLSDARDAIWDANAAELAAQTECSVSDSRDAVGDCDAGQVGAIIERILPYAADSSAVDRAWNGHLTPTPGVARDADCAAADRVVELASHGGFRGK
jgi:hypothetical protein